MSAPVSLLILCGVSALFYLEARTLLRELRTGVPHLFFWPHPAYRNRAAHRGSVFLWFSTAMHIFGTFGLALMVVVGGAFLLESLGVIY
jgi:hypothetical protein